MKPNIPKPYLSLPDKDKRKIDEFVAQLVENLVNIQLDKEEVEAQKIWLQYACIVLHRAFGMEAEELLQFLVPWKRMYHQNAKMRTNEEQAEFLKKEMTKLFGEGGYPYEWIEKLAESKEDK